MQQLIGLNWVITGVSYQSWAWTRRRPQTKWRYVISPNNLFWIQLKSKHVSKYVSKYESLPASRKKFLLRRHHHLFWFPFSHTWGWSSPVWCADIVRMIFWVTTWWIHAQYQTVQYKGFYQKKQSLRLWAGHSINTLQLVDHVHVFVQQITVRKHCFNNPGFIFTFTKGFLVRL